MSWLDKIEEGNHRAREALGRMPTMSNKESTYECMARVIRELCAYITANEAVQQCQAPHTSLEMIELINNRLDTYQSLSPEAKEVLND